MPKSAVRAGYEQHRGRVDGVGCAVPGFKALIVVYELIANCRAVERFLPCAPRFRVDRGRFRIVPMLAAVRAIRHDALREDIPTTSSCRPRRLESIQRNGRRTASAEAQQRGKANRECVVLTLTATNRYRIGCSKSPYRIGLRPPPRCGAGCARRHRRRDGAGGLPYERRHRRDRRPRCSTATRGELMSVVVWSRGPCRRAGIGATSFGFRGRTHPRTRVPQFVQRVSAECVRADAGRGVVVHPLAPARTVLLTVRVVKARGQPRSRLRN